MIDLSPLRDVRTDYFVLGAVAISFVLGGLAVELGGSRGAFAGGGVVVLGALVVWYFDSVVRIPDTSHARAAESLRESARELDRLEELRRHEDAEDESAEEDDGDDLDSESVEDLSDRSGLDLDRGREESV